MRWLVKGLGAVLAIVLVVCALLIIAAMIFGTPLDHTVIQIDDASFAIGDLRGHWVMAFVILAVTCVAVVVVVPLAVAVSLALAAVAIGVSLALAAAVVALACSPLILLVWILWRLLRKSPAQPPKQPTLQQPLQPPASNSPAVAP